ncbi:hypothetical protein PRZ48_004478 [Zasmidium cellare]|uniref:MYND-type domain-containing protein n=1 Tax=Zasmidium cellare TaxID=395010 RepID=A0ABR0ER39_ZASCE|nr:hypothetical protein PRZ48_004478 [Zasmidium cellare]
MAAQRNMFAMLADEDDETSSTSQQQTDDDALTVYTPLTDTHPSDDADDVEAPQDGVLSPEAIQARAEATRHKQMRAFLLGFHENYHGPEEPLGNGIWGAVVQPRGKHAVPDPDNPIEDDTSFRSNIIPVPGSTASYENPDNVWLTPELPAKLGFPIKVTTWPFPYGRGGDLKKYNYFVHTLFTGADASKSSFAKFTREAYTGEALIVRTDGKDMSDQQLEVLLHFINDEFSVAAMQLLDMEEGKEKDKVKKGIAEKYLNPEALHAYWQEYRREMITNGRVWEDAISPVKVTLGEVKPACGRCFSRKAKEKQFLFCEGCEDRFYCSKVCSDRDEKRHSKICFMEDKNGDSGLDSGDSVDTQSSGVCRSDDNV